MREYGKHKTKPVWKKFADGGPVEYSDAGEDKVTTTKSVPCPKGWNNTGEQCEAPEANMSNDNE